MSVEDPSRLPLTHTWSLYAHLQAVSSTFQSSYLKLAEMTNIKDFWCVFNNIASCQDLHTNIVVIDNKRIIAYSFFKDDITPEWEHPTNYAGSEWGCREHMSAMTFESLFASLVVAAANDELEHVVGVRCINKCNRTRSLFKIEVWMDTCEPDVTHTVWQHIEAISAQCEEQPVFTLLDHQDKQTKAYEYVKKRHVRRKK